jgi:hypothetical protein
LERPPYVDADFYALTSLSLQSLKSFPSFQVAFGVTHGVGVTDRRGKERWGILEQLVSPFYFTNLTLLAAMVIQGGYFLGLVEKSSCQRMKLEMYDL